MIHAYLLETIVGFGYIYRMANRFSKKKKKRRRRRRRRRRKKANKKKRPILFNSFYLMEI